MEISLSCCSTWTVEGEAVALLKATPNEFHRHGGKKRRMHSQLPLSMSNSFIRSMPHSGHSVDASSSSLFMYLDASSSLRSPADTCLNSPFNKNLSTRCGIRNHAVADLLFQGEVCRDMLYHALQACMRTHNLANCRRVHTLVIASGHELVAVFNDHLIRLFALCGKLEDARMVFVKVPEPSVYTWHAIISAHVNFAEGEKALSLYNIMQVEGIEPDKVIISCILKACGMVGALMQGRCMHEQAAQMDCQADLVVATTLIDMYARCNCLEEARDIFEDLPLRDARVWATMIAGYAEQGDGGAAYALYTRMHHGGFKPDALFLSMILPSFGSGKAIEHGELILDHAIGLGLGNHVAICNSLLSMYLKSGNLAKAQKIFDEIETRDFVSWNSIIGGYANHGDAIFAFGLLESMRQEGFNPDKGTLVCLLKAHESADRIRPGRYLHIHIVTIGLDSDLRVGSALLVMYSRIGFMEDAHKIFDGLPSKDRITWNALMSGYVHQGSGLLALELLNRMKDQGIPPDKVTFLNSLKACGMVENLPQAKMVHEQIQHSGLEPDLAIGSALIDMYANCGSLEEASKSFDRMLQRNLVSYSAMIAAFVQHEANESAIDLFNKMERDGIKPDLTAYSCVLRACSNLGDIAQGELTHKKMIKDGVEVDEIAATALIDLYGNAGQIQKMSQVFEGLPFKDLAVWHALIAKCTHWCDWVNALHLFNHMRYHGIEADVFTATCVLKAYGNIGDGEQGKILHAEVIRRGLLFDQAIGNALVDMYAKCGNLEEANHVFENLPAQNQLSWASLMTAYMQHGEGGAAFDLFVEMQCKGIEPDEVTCSCILKACSIANDLKEGMVIHDLIVAHGFDLDAVVRTAVIDMYCKCSRLEEAHKVFDGSPHRDVGCWNALIVGYSEHGQDVLAIELFQRLQEEHIAYDMVTISSMLKVCGQLGALEQGELIHGQVISCGWKSETCIGTSLVDMYAKCGSLLNACKAFEDVPVKDLISWSSIIAGCAQHGDCSLALECFHDMQKQGVMPNETIFTSILAACARGGSLKDARQVFACMTEHYGIPRYVEHFNCMVDLLGKKKHFEEAEELLELMPMPPDITSWMSLLTACRTHTNLELGRYCFSHVVRLDPGLATGFVLMSNIYANAGMRESALKLEEMRKCLVIQKKPGKAYIEVNKMVHEFVAGDTSHDHIDEIHGKLQDLQVEMKAAGYTPHLDLVLKPISDTEKADALYGHCEKLALAFGLLNTPQGTTLRISKNIRTCPDCHDACKVVSKTQRRQIIISDTYRIHKFQDGLCSCGDFG